MSKMQLPSELQQELVDTLSEILTNPYTQMAVGASNKAAGVLKAVQEARTLQNLTVVATGNPIDGFTFFGPFHTHEDAFVWCDGENWEGPWWTAELSEPNENYDPIG